MTDDDKAMYRSAVVTGNLDEFAILYKDAARYRWLRDNAYHATAGPNGKMTWCVTGEGCSTEEPIYGEALDAAIDATMKTQNAGLECAFLGGQNEFQNVVGKRRT